MTEVTIKLPARPDQNEFNLRRWEELAADPFLATLGQRIETDRHGQIIMTPPAQNPHSEHQSKILILLHQLLPDGEARVEAPISTADGIKAADAAWCSRARWGRIYDVRAFTEAPEICVEVISPANTKEEMADKMRLYFAAGASEVWLCRDDGAIEFHIDSESDPETGPAKRSLLCPDFPPAIH